MATDPNQVKIDADYLTSQPGWQDEGKRREYIRDVAARSAQSPEYEPEQHAAVMQELWKRSDPRGGAQKALEWGGQALKEIAYSMPAAGGALTLAGLDALGVTDSGSGIRLKRGVAGMADAAVQRAKSMAPNDKQQQRDTALDALKHDLDARLYPEGLEAWMAGAPTDDLDDETKQWVDGLTFGLGRKAVAADHGALDVEKGEAGREKVRQWVESDRSPNRLKDDLGGPGPKALLADYLVTRDPASWEAFKARVSETDTQRTTRLQRFANEAELRQVQAASTGGVADNLTTRSAEFQTSPIDIVATVLPFLQGAKAYQAARAGGKLKAVIEAGKGVGMETVSEGVTEALQDPNAPTSQILNAAAMGTVGAAAVTGAGAGAGAVMNKLQSPPATVTPPVPAAPATEAASGSGVLAQIAAAQGAASPVSPIAASPGSPVPPSATAPAPQTPVPQGSMGGVPSGTATPIDTSAPVPDTVPNAGGTASAVQSRGLSPEDFADDRFLRRQGDPGKIDFARSGPPSHPQAGLAQDIASLWGAPVKWFTPSGSGGDSFTEGMTEAAREPGARPTIWLNTKNPQRALPRVVGHEGLHWMSEQHPDLYGEVYGHFTQMEQAGQLRSKWFADWLGKRGYQPKEITAEEMMAHLAGDFFTDPEFVTKTFESNPGLGARVMQALMRFVDAMKEIFSRREMRTGPIRTGSTAFLKGPEALESLRTKLAEAYRGMEARARDKGEGPSFAKASEGAARGAAEGGAKRSLVPEEQDTLPPRPEVPVGYADWQAHGVDEAGLKAALDEEWRAFHTAGKSFEKSDAEIAAEWRKELADPNGGTVAYAIESWKREQRGPLSDAVQFDVDHAVSADVDASAKVVDAQTGAAKMSNAPPSASNVTPEQDRAYLDAVERGDMETAQRMVDEAAKRAGYGVKAYHGTNANFASFDPSRVGESTDVVDASTRIWFTNNPDVAKRFGSRVIAAYLKMGDLHEATTGARYQRITRILDSEIPEESGRLLGQVKDAAFADAGDVDTVIFHNVKDGSDHRSDVYAVKSPSQIKSADLVTYDEQGNIIPLSQRFNPQTGEVKMSKAPPPGERPVGSVGPEPEVKTRAFGQRVAADPRMNPKVQAQAAQQYAPVSNQDTQAQVNEIINTSGIEGAAAAFGDASNGMPEHVRVALGMQLMVRLDAEARALRNAGDMAGAASLWQRVGDLGQTVDTMGTAAGRAVQAFAMWSRMTPEGVLASFEKRVREVNQGTMPPLPAELLTKLGDLRDKINALPAESPVRGDLMREMLNELALYEGIPLRNVMTSLWYANLLSGLTTQGMNMYGNGFGLMLRSIAAVAANHPSDGLRLLGGMLRGLDRGLTEARAALKGQVTSRNLQDAPTVSQHIQQSALETMLGRKPRDAKSWATWFLSVGGLTKYVSRLMTGMDAAFYYTAAEGRAHLAASRAARQGHKPGTPEFVQAMANLLGRGEGAWQAAMDQARDQLRAAGKPVTKQDVKRVAYQIMDATRDPEVLAEGARFGELVTSQQEPDGLAASLSHVISAVQGMPLGRVILPFNRTLVNLMSNAADFTPVGIARGLKGSHLWNPREEFAAWEARERLVAGIMGTATMAIAAGLAMRHKDEDDQTVPFMIYGFGPDNKAKREQMPERWKPFTIKIGNHYVSYAETPLVYALAPVGAMMDAMRYKDLSEKSAAERMGYYAQTVMKTSSSQGVLSSAADFFGMMTGETSPAKLPSRVVGGFIPGQGFLRDVTGLFDPVKISDDTVAASILRDVPVLRHMAGRPALDYMGDPITYKGLSRIPVIKRLVTDQRTEDRDKAWVGQMKLSIPGMPSTIEVGDYLTKGESMAAQAARGDAMMLTREELFEFQRSAGRHTREAVKQLRNAWGDTVAVTPEQREAIQKRLNAKVRAARAMAMRETLGR